MPRQGTWPPGLAGKSAPPGLAGKSAPPGRLRAGPPTDSAEVPVTGLGGSGPAGAGRV